MKEEILLYKDLKKKMEKNYLKIYKNFINKMNKLI